MKYPPKSIAFRSRVIGLPYCESELTGACSCRKDVSRISANFSNCDGVYFQKRITSTTGECAERTLPQLLFYIAESFNVAQIFQRCTNHSTSYKFCGEVKNHSTLYKSFNAIQIIQRRTNLSTLYKSFDVVQILRRSKKSFKVIQIILRSTNHST